MKTHNFACLFDIDGVITKGPNFIAVAKPAIQALVQLNVPIVFLSNTCTFEADKAKQLSAMLGITIDPEQVVLAQTPMRTLTEYHNKHVLISGQGATEEIGRILGFKSITTIEKVCEAFPELDMVNHMHRAKFSELIQTQSLVRDTSFRPIDAIVLLGEPINWESSLQVITDLLLTDGNPAVVPIDTTVNRDHIPVIACNRDLVFKAAADLPRFGHGAFLTCLEALYKNLSGTDLVYKAFVGKPFEVSFQYAEIMANKIALANGQPKIDKIYFVGDNPDVDIVGANMYNCLLQQDSNCRTSISGYDLISDAKHLSATSCESILVCTGVYDPNKQLTAEREHWKIPTVMKHDVLEAVEYILKQEESSWNN
jgi:HAD superfamily hydrolase (TIGR01456 family)